MSAEQAQEKAKEFAFNTFKSVNFHLDSLSEEEFKLTADTIIANLAYAYFNGWYISTQ